MLTQQNNFKVQHTKQRPASPICFFLCPTVCLGLFPWLPIPHGMHGVNRIPDFQGVIQCYQGTSVSYDSFPEIRPDVAPFCCMPVSSFNMAVSTFLFHNFIFLLFPFWLIHKILLGLFGRLFLSEITIINTIIKIKVLLYFGGHYKIWFTKISRSWGNPHNSIISQTMQKNNGRSKIYT